MKSPIVKVHLSNKDTKILCDELKDTLIFILYELSSELIQKEFLNKLKSGTCITLTNIINKIHDSGVLRNITDNYESFIDNIRLNVTIIERKSRYSYRLHFKKNWEVDIIINDIRKLVSWRNILLYEIMNPQKSYIDIVEPHNNSKILISKTINPVKSPDFLKLSECNFNNTSDIGIHTTSKSDSTLIHSTIQNKIKFQSYHKYDSMVHFGKCIDIYILNRPKKVRET